MSATRVLTLQRSIVPVGDRKKFLDKVRARHTYYVTAKCEHWVFEEVELPGAFIEFIEAADGETLGRALAGAPDPVLDRARIYQSVELG
jgi:hypothetical protein